jgi:protein SFI1
MKHVENMAKQRDHVLCLNLASPTMAVFQPTRASSPSKSLSKIKTAESSLPTSVMVPELKDLSAEDVELLDAVIQRAGPCATTFLTVFKAYSEILNERGLDPHEVVCYGKLLKLGTLKGKNWGDKWMMVKDQYDTVSSVPKTATNLTGLKHDRFSTPTTIVSFKPSFDLHVPSNDSETLNSHENDSVQLNSDVALIDESNHPHARRAFRSIAQSRRSLNYSEATLNDNTANVPRHTFTPRLPVVPFDCNASVSGVSDVSEPVSSVIPSQIQHIPFRKPPSLKKLDAVRTRLNMPSQITADVARKAIAQARKLKGSVVNEDDAWRKIKFQRDEQDADTFRQDRLMERCWEIWKQGFQWIIVRTYCTFLFECLSFMRQIDNQYSNI